MKPIERLSEIPLQPGYAILEEIEIYHEGDERSRNFPGHGYPAYTEKFVRVLAVFDTEEAMLGALRGIDPLNKYRKVRGLKITSYEMKLTLQIAPVASPAFDLLKTVSDAGTA